MQVIPTKHGFHVVLLKCDEATEEMAKCLAENTSKPYAVFVGDTLTYKMIEKKLEETNEDSPLPFYAAAGYRRGSVPILSDVHWTREEMDKIYALGFNPLKHDPHSSGYVIWGDQICDAYWNDWSFGSPSGQVPVKSLSTYRLLYYISQAETDEGKIERALKWAPSRENAYVRNDCLAVKPPSCVVSFLFPLKGGEVEAMVDHTKKVIEETTKGFMYEAALLYADKPGAMSGQTYTEEALKRMVEGESKLRYDEEMRCIILTVETNKNASQSNDT